MSARTPRWQAKRPRREIPFIEPISPVATASMSKGGSARLKLNYHASFSNRTEFDIRSIRALFFNAGERLMTGILVTRRRFLLDEDGASLPEYALLLALITIVCIAAMSARISRERLPQYDGFNDLVG